jgi:uncharacterized protein (TIGR03437 family)
MATRWLLAAVAAGPLIAAAETAPAAPNYTADSIANTAANVAGVFAPNTFITVYGSNLSDITRAIGPDDIHGGTLPTLLPGAGVRVLVNQIPANLYYVSPGQVNALLPPSLSPGNVTLQVTRDGLAGPEVVLKLAPEAPAIFQSDARTVIATHANGALVTATAPARPGEVVVLYASGLGATSPAAIANKITQTAAQVANLDAFRVWLNGQEVDSKRVAYAGLTPGFAGLYQVNLQLPADAPADPEIRVGYPGAQSPPGRFLPLH